MNRFSIQLISYGPFERQFLERIAFRVKTEFEMPVEVLEKGLELTDFYEPTRRQYNANRLLKYMESMVNSNEFKSIGLFHVDLFIPILTFIFGQAIFNGNTGIASVYRLKNELYGMLRDENLLFERFVKVIIHELGHTFGLIHCHVPTCVMRPGTYVEDIDQKKHHLCPKCREEFEINKI
ncbi:MAG: archaemetzincin family Zn-dependent metalloprotease [Prolixibacteraceae bacterium]|nr:archaemetzincin family Zn-dependent metalloprotease [Prolixibacteraceae bacterium]MBN2773515.1 archaemetzincin family Zn-dependent metalloprotease [Prolixibacteraceae bacterium]